jgi:hypothetical protein
MLCRECGTENADNVAFCKRCGARLTSHRGPASTRPPFRADEPPPPPGYYADVSRPSQIFFMAPVLAAFDRGAFFRTIFATILRVFAVLYCVGVGIFCLYLFAAAVDKGDAGAIVLAILGDVLIIFFAYMLVHAVFIRARQIAELPEGEYTVIRSVSVFFKLLGEWSFISSFPNFIVGLLLLFGAWGALGSGLFGILYGGGMFLVSLLYVCSPVIGFLALVFCYWLSEQTIVFADIALNTRGLRRASPQEAPTP